MMHRPSQRMAVRVRRAGEREVGLGCGEAGTTAVCCVKRCDVAWCVGSTEKKHHHDDYGGRAVSVSLLRAGDRGRTPERTERKDRTMTMSDFRLPTSETSECEFRPRQ